MKLVSAILLLFYIMPLASPQVIPVIAGVNTSMFESYLARLAAIPDSTTLFVPTNEAFALLNADFLDSLVNLPEWNSFLREVVSFHMVAGNKKIADLRNRPLRTESNGREIDVTTSSHLPLVNGAQIMYSDLVGSKGVVHIINRVLIPQDMAVESLGTVLRRRYPNTKIFWDAVTAAQLLPAFENLSPKRIFIPTNDAFGSLPKGALENFLLPVNRGFLQFLILNHVVDVPRYTQTNSPVVMATRVGGRNLVSSNLLTQLWSNGAQFQNISLSSKPIYAHNARFQLINTLLIPPENALLRVGDNIAGVAGSPYASLASTFQSAITASGIISVHLNTKKDLTVFVPTDAAFAKLPPGFLRQVLSNTSLTRDLLNAHISQGISFTNRELGRTVTSVPTQYPGFSISASRLDSGKLLLNGRATTLPLTTPVSVYSEYPGTNGLIHFVDTVFVPPHLALADPMSILSRGVYGNFSTFLAIAERASTVQGMTYPSILSARINPTTLFAPTNEAFNLLPKGYLEYLLKPEHIDELTALFLYHFSRGVVYSTDLKNWTYVSLSNRESFNFRSLVTGVSVNPFDEITFNNGRVISSDIPSTNGPIHVIDKVIIPPSISPVDVYQTLLINNLGEIANVFASTNTTPLLTRVGRELFTLFVPRNGLVNTSSQTRAFASANALNYIVNGTSRLFAELAPTQLFTAVGGKVLNVTRVNSTTVVVNGARISRSDIIAKNGIIHVVEGLL